MVPPPREIGRATCGYLWSRSKVTPISSSRYLVVQYTCLLATSRPSIQSSCLPISPSLSTYLRTVRGIDTLSIPYLSFILAFLDSGGGGGGDISYIRHPITSFQSPYVCFISAFLDSSRTYHTYMEHPTPSHPIPSRRLKVHTYLPSYLITP